MVGGHYAAQGLSCLIVVSGFAGLCEGCELCFDFILLERTVVLDEDEAVVGLVEVFGLDQKLLVEFFAGAQAGFHDFDALGAHEADHVFGKVQDLHGLAHVKHEQFAVPGHGPRREHQLAGLGYGHEVSYDSLVGNGHRAALLDLLSEKRNHASGTSEYIAEPRGTVFGLALGVCAGALDQHLAHPLGGAHDIGGVHRLVRADHHEALCAVFLAAVDHVPAAEHVVLYGLDAVVLHQRHVLVRRGIDHYLGFVGFEYSFECFYVGDRADLDLGLQIAAVFDPQFLLHVVGTVLVDVQDYQLVGVHLGQLTADLASDASAAARDQDRLSLVVFLGSVVHNELLASEQQLLHAEVSEPDLGSEIGVEHLGRVVDTHLAAGALVGLIQLLPLLVVQTRRENHLLHVQILEYLREILIVLVEHLQVEYLPPGLFLADIDEAHGVVDRILVGHQLLGQTHADVARPQDGHVDLALLILAHVLQAADRS